jgi:hypothetical protein
VTVYEDPGVRFSSLGHVLLAVWRAPPDAVRMIAMRTWQQRAAETHPELVMFHVIHAGETSPVSMPDEHRGAFLRAMRAGAGTPSIAAVAVEGRPFFAAGWRSFMAGAILRAKLKHPVRVFGDRQQAAEWLERETARSPAKLQAGMLLGALALVERGLEPQ